jgi:hypothetical protein
MVVGEQFWVWVQVQEQDLQPLQLHLLGMTMLQQRQRQQQPQYVSFLGLFCRSWQKRKLNGTRMLIYCSM